MLTRSVARQLCSQALQHLAVRGGERARRRLPSAEKNLLKDLLVNVVADALYYNPALALRELQAQGRLTAFFSTWFQARRGRACCRCLQAKLPVRS